MPHDSYILPLVQAGWLGATVVVIAAVCVKTSDNEYQRHNMLTDMDQVDIPVHQKSLEHLVY